MARRETILYSVTSWWHCVGSSCTKPSMSCQEGGDSVRSFVEIRSNTLPRDFSAWKQRRSNFGPFDSKRTYFGTIDCVHCETNEFRTDPNSKWYSHKHNGAGVSYEVVVDICRDRILWTAGLKPASTHDITFFRGGTQVSTNRQKNEVTWDKNALYFQVPEGKKVIGNSGYKGEPSKLSTSVDEHSDKVKEFFARSKSRQETINTRLKSFNVLSGRFRHGKGVENKLEAHQRVFEAVCVLVQYDLKFHPLMEI